MAERFSGKIITQQEIKVVGEYSFHDIGSITKWQGKIQAIGGLPLPVGNFDLVLDDGRRAAILITSSASSSHGSSWSAFSGNGPPPS